MRQVVFEAWERHRGRMLLSAMLTIFTASVGAAPASAQTAFCREALGARPRLDADSSLGRIYRAYPELRALDTAIVRHAGELRIVGGEVLPLGAGQAARLFPEEPSKFAADTQLARAAAVVLTYLMAGPSRVESSDQASVASELYEIWHLPPEPAMTLLKANWASAETRKFALNALGGYVGDTALFMAEAAALCSLAARSEGIAEWLGSPANASVADLLDDGEMSLLFRLVVELRPSNGSATTNHPLRTLLPERNPVSAYIRRWRPELW